MSKVDIVKQILEDSNPDLNLNPGGAIEGLVVIPSATVFDDIDEQGQQIQQDAALITASTSERKDALLSNFGLVRIQGTQGLGVIKVVVTDLIAFYNFPTGTEFTEPETGLILQSTSDVTITPSETLEAEIPVATVENTSQVLEVGTILNSSLFGNLITSVTVVQQVGGGSDIESDDELTERIIEDLSENGLTVSSLRTRILKAFPTLLDVQIEKVQLKAVSGRPSGIRADVYIKSLLESKTVVLNVENNTAVLEDTVSEISSTSRAILSSVISNQGTDFQKNTYIVAEDDSSNTVTITYLSPVELSNVQSYLDDEDETPVGVNFIAVAGTPIFVSSDDVVLNSVYINQHPMENFSVSSLITDTGLTDFELPIEIEMQNGYTGETTIVTNRDDQFYPAYYVR